MSLAHDFFLMFKSKQMSTGAVAIAMLILWCGRDEAKRFPTLRAFSLSRPFIEFHVCRWKAEEPKNALPDINHDALLFYEFLMIFYAHH